MPFFHTQSSAYGRHRIQHLHLNFHTQGMRCVVESLIPHAALGLLSSSGSNSVYLFPNCPPYSSVMLPPSALARTLFAFEDIAWMAKLSGKRALRADTTSPTDITILICLLMFT